MERENTRRDSVLAACTLVIIAANGISLLTTAIGLKQAFFREDTALDLLFVGALSLVIQLTKASLDRLPRKSAWLWGIYAAALVLSSTFSAQSMTAAAYPEAHFAASAQQTLTAQYTARLLDIQNDAASELDTARDSLWTDLEAVRASLDTGESDLDAEKMLSRYEETDDFDPQDDAGYLALEAALEDMADKDYESAGAEVGSALAALDAEDNEEAGTKAAQEIEDIRRQMNRAGLIQAQREALSEQLSAAIRRQAGQQARTETRRRIRSDLECVRKSLEKGALLAARSIDQLEKALLQKEQTPADLRTLLDTALNNADTDMDMKSGAALRDTLERYISLLETNTELLDRISALEDTGTEAAAAESWQSFWNDRLGSLRSEVAASGLEASARNEYIAKLDTLLRRYTTSHSPLEFMAVCMLSKGNALAIVCVVLALVLDLAGLAANVVARNL